MSVRYDVKVALKYYRYLQAYCEHAIDAMDWYLGSYKMPTEIESIKSSRADTLTFLAHMQKAIEIYREMCEIDGCQRRATVIIRKFIDPAGGSDGKGKPYTNDELAKLLNCDIKTIKNDIRDGYYKLAVLFFGIHGL